ncbi:MAG: hypothetical protein HY269_06990 [Deltaproteobacteria bacterium]|nr:hypothetical protein [Deltaproteobacteria bacterium]
MVTAVSSMFSSLRDAVEAAKIPGSRQLSAETLRDKRAEEGVKEHKTFIFSETL